MPPTRITGLQVKDGSVQRVDLDTTTSGQAVIARVAVNASYLSMSSTGVDAGTGDVTINLLDSGVVAGTYPVVTVDIKGRVTGGRALAASDLPTTGIGTGTATKVTYDNYGRITAVSSLAAGDIPSGSTYYVQNQSATAQSASMRVTGSVGGGALRVYEGTATYYTEFLAASSLSANRSFTWPNGYGTSGDLLSTDGAGALSWLTLSSTYVPVAGATTVTGRKTFSAGLAVTNSSLAVTKSSTTVSLIHFDGRSGSRQVIDVCGNRWNNVANPLSAALNTTTYKFGKSALQLNGTNQYLELVGTDFTSFAFGSGSFTVECWVNFTSTTGTQTIFDFGGSAAGIILQYVSGTGLQVLSLGSTFSFSTTPSTSTWYHIAVVRNGTSLAVYVNGAQVGTTQTLSGSLACNFAPTVGAKGKLGDTALPTNFLAAYIDEFAVHTTAKWTTGFTAPTAANDFANITNYSASATEPVDAGMTFVTDGVGNASLQAPTRTFVAQFSLTETVANTAKYFYSWRGQGATQDDAARSGNSSGMSFANSCSPIIMPFNGRLVKAMLTVQGAGVNQAAATYPCAYQVQLYRVGWTTEHDSTINSGNPVQINFPIQSGVGGYSVSSTNAKVEKTDLATPVNSGDRLALKFLNGATAAIVGITQQAHVTLVFEEIA